MLFFIFKEFLCKLYEMLACAWKEFVSVGEHNIYKTTEIKYFILEHYCVHFLTTKNHWILLVYSPFNINAKYLQNSQGYWVFSYSEVSINCNLVSFTTLCYYLYNNQPHEIATGPNLAWLFIARICCTWYLTCSRSVLSATIKLHMIRPYRSFNQCKFHQDVCPDRSVFCSLFDQTIEKLWVLYVQYPL